MTLVAGISAGGMPAFIGDLLLWRRVPTPIDLPTRAGPGVTPGMDRDFAAGMAQKLVIVRPYLLVAWAGVRAEAERIIRELDRILPAQTEAYAHAGAVDEILRTCSDETELLILRIDGASVLPTGVGTRGFELDGKRIYLMGTGGSDFFQYLEEHPEILAGDENAEGFLARAIALRFGARAMTFQLLIGTGLENSWGGGFEVAYPEPGGFRKCDRLLFRAWKIDADGGCENSGRSFFARYYARDLFISCFNPEEKTWIVRAPVGEPGIPPPYERVHPTWTMDLFVHEPTGSFVEMARFHPQHRSVADFVEFVDGQIAGWSMDQTYVETCVRTAIAHAGSGNSYGVQRY